MEEARPEELIEGSPAQVVKKRFNVKDIPLTPAQQAIRDNAARKVAQQKASTDKWRAKVKDAQPLSSIVLSKNPLATALANPKKGEGSTLKVKDTIEKILFKANKETKETRFEKLLTQALELAESPSTSLNQKLAFINYISERVEGKTAVIDGNAGGSNSLTINISNRFAPVPNTTQIIELGKEHKDEDIIEGEVVEGDDA